MLWPGADALAPGAGRPTPSAAHQVCFRSRVAPGRPRFRPTRGYRHQGTLGMLRSRGTGPRKAERKKEECTVCRARCRIIFLTEQLSPDVRSFFMDVNLLCKKYAKEFAQVSDFQESHRRRCLAFYKEKIAKLEEMNKKLSRQIEQLQSTRSPQALSRVQSSTTINSSSSSHLEKQKGYSSCLHPLAHQLSSNVDDSMEVDASSQFKKPESMPGPNRLSLISPPRDGRMGYLVKRLIMCSINLNTVVPQLSPWSCY
ncbi:hypothetical protein NDU88_001283 [Pleurodeles waltl]|uniref:Uncharacterized protein n=1 Tax=Pleurodeles waltl TaxID=8319 RepID=A0AAV7WL22_PLEWA|nr:hypothetical protein NDU88_001283 [Pleurodeles waltl]